MLVGVLAAHAGVQPTVMVLGVACLVGVGSAALCSRYVAA